MLRVEWYIFIRNRRFVSISATPLLLVLVQGFVTYAATQVGLLRTTGYEFAFRSLNLYSVLFLPFLSVAMGVYLLSAEFQWQTIRRPFTDHISRQRFLLTKAVAVVLVLVMLMVPYAVGTLIVGALLFGFVPELFEDQQLSVLSSLVHLLSAYAWGGLLLYPFIIGGQTLFLRTKNLLIAVLGTLLPFYIIVAFGERLPIAPIRLLFSLQQRFLDTVAYDVGFVQDILVAGIVWCLFLAGVLYIHIRAFARQDILIH